VPFYARQPSLVLTPLMATAGHFERMGEVSCFAGDFVPRGFREANGRLLSIAQNQALLSRRGNTFAGGGRGTCALPGPRGRRPGPGLIGVEPGSRFGAERTFPASDDLPSHCRAVERLVPSAPIPLPARLPLGAPGGLVLLGARGHAA
jgi:microcystin-dependent protein